MKNMKKFAALTLSAAMTLSLAASVSAAVESKDDLPGKKIGVQLGTTGDLEASEYEKDGATVERYSKGARQLWH